MNRETKALLSKAIDSLILSIEIFNRPHDTGRSTTTLILLDHSFEMLLKASILRRGGLIRAPKESQTIGFDACVRKAVSDGFIKFLSEEQALTIQAVNGLRDAAQHHIVEVSESQLYLHAISSVTLFRDIMVAVFDQELIDHLPDRVLPLSTRAPLDLIAMFEVEIEEIKKLLQPGKRRVSEATTRLRPLEILETTIGGERMQPSERVLKRKCSQIIEGKSVDEIFPNITSLSITHEGEGPSFRLRFTKKEGIPINVVAEGTPGAYVVGMKRVNELDFYNHGLDSLAKKVGLTSPKTFVVIQELGLQEDENCYKCIVIGKMNLKRYSQNAAKRIEESLPDLKMDEVWERHRPRKKLSN